VALVALALAAFFPTGFRKVPTAGSPEALVVEGMNGSARQAYVDYIMLGGGDVYVSYNAKIFDMISRTRPSAGRVHIDKSIYSKMTIAAKTVVSGMDKFSRSAYINLIIQDAKHSHFDLILLEIFRKQLAEGEIHSVATMLSHMPIDSFSGDVAYDLATVRTQDDIILLFDAYDGCDDPVNKQAIIAELIRAFPSVTGDSLEQRIRNIRSWYLANRGKLKVNGAFARTLSAAPGEMGDASGLFIFFAEEI